MSSVDYKLDYQTLYPLLEELAKHQNSFFMNSFLREKQKKNHSRKSGSVRSLSYKTKGSSLSTHDYRRCSPFSLRVPVK